ncbi:aspartate/glutamate racemase family protein [Govanella unica]|uniref:Aspartate/glutamate racemase family protein n=1 Tax=Govanella unica TaxID=2975056 RepID=A0A9X3TY33_9PROT|nr:aspartate/glutamate racemase family protein [Govania unica]MDA5193829.1 aspartate/glutamate racemase family protein [Govania unica]
MKRICVIAPIIESASYNNDEMSEYLKSFDVPNHISVEARCLKNGPSSIESEIDDALAIPDILRVGLEAQAEGFHGVVMACMADPGVRALREALSIPVVGTAESSFHIAASLGSRFGILDVTDDARTSVKNLMAIYGLTEKFASFRSVNIQPEQISTDMTATNNALISEAQKAVRQDQADVLVLNCTGFYGCAQAVSDALAADGLHVPVIDPMPLTIRLMSALVLEGLCHSKRAYPTPHKNKFIQGYVFPDFYNPASL